ncbi:hypothetical protein [Agromyces aerolatus]|uniref:hypothetical protein n=1 Tax=Agromyces sp. LY-1074 TaxID=3074080 RepID=UPI002861CBC1|nr:MULTISPECIES: hypothetical protein [unclassified Agromyces]MDR5699137.1 hypothetical protein [Agromyces sp. LY-1074]MDR5705084.1 hypothetical protein [Agromyces sp. LY-1358]
MTDGTHPLTRVGAATSLEVGVGHMLLNIAEPTPGRERAYTRWYEDDHFFSAAMMAPFVFAGRRWVASEELRALDHGRAGGESDPPARERFAATYWIAPGHLNDYFAWAAGTGPQLDAQGRNFTDRRLVFVSFADHVGSVYRDERAPRDVFALMDPPGGMVVQLIDVPDASVRDDAATWLIDDAIPNRLALDGASTQSVLVFRGASDTSAMRPALQEVQRASDHDGRRLILLWLLDDDPRSAWAREFADLPEVVASSGCGTVEWMAPFAPARMGTGGLEK